MAMAGWSASTTKRSGRRRCPSSCARRSKRRLRERDAANDGVLVLAVGVGQVAAELPAGPPVTPEDAARPLETSLGIRRDAAHVEDLGVLVARDLLLDGRRA